MRKIMRHDFWYISVFALNMQCALVHNDHHKIKESLLGNWKIQANAWKCMKLCMTSDLFPSKPWAKSILVHDSCKNHIVTPVGWLTRNQTMDINEIFATSITINYIDISIWCLFVCYTIIILLLFWLLLLVPFGTESNLYLRRREDDVLWHMLVTEIIWCCYILLEPRAWMNNHLHKNGEIEREREQRKIYQIMKD